MITKREIKINYDQDRRHLTIFIDGKLKGGLIGEFAEQQYRLLKLRINNLNKFNELSHDNRKAQKV